MQFKLTNISSILIVLLLVGNMSSCTDAEINLTGANFLNIKDSISINLPETVFGNSNNIQILDSVIIVNNEGSNAVSLLDMKGNIIKELDFKRFASSDSSFEVSFIWMFNQDSIFVYSSKATKFFLFDKSLNILGTLTRPEPNGDTSIYRPTPFMTTSSQPTFYDSTLFYTGFIIGENRKIGEKVGFVLEGLQKSQRKYFVEYPSAYETNYWGGIYFNMVSSTLMNDSTICISFAAGSEVALINLKTKIVTYKKIYPDLTKYQTRFSGNKFRSKDFSTKSQRCTISLNTMEAV